VVPVCAGISLEYYFSYVDNTGWGSGTKLPHNITSLLGVMDGAESDLRTGLPWQMWRSTSLSESLFLIETSPETILKIMGRNAVIDRLCRTTGSSFVAAPRHGRGQRLRRRRVPPASAAGNVLGLRPESTTAYLCGHPNMVENARGILQRAHWRKDAMLEELYFQGGEEFRSRVKLTRRPPKIPTLGNLRARLVYLKLARHVIQR